MLTKQLLDTTRGRIVRVLHRAPSTVEEIASPLGLTRNAVRAQLSAMERDGVVRRSGRRPGATRPSDLFELTAEVEQLLSRAYVPLLTHLVRVFADGLPAKQVVSLMREAGKGLADDLSPAMRPAGNLESRVARASALMNEQLGATTHVEKNGGFVIQGAACPLSALTGKHPAVCLAMESLLREVIGKPVKECCSRTGRPQCCFRIAR